MILGSLKTVFHQSVTIILLTYERLDSEKEWDRACRVFGTK